MFDRNADVEGGAWERIGAWGREAFKGCDNGFVELPSNRQYGAGCMACLRAARRAWSVAFLEYSNPRQVSFTYKGDFPLLGGHGLGSNGAWAQRVAPSAAGAK